MPNTIDRRSFLAGSAALGAGGVIVRPGHFQRALLDLASTSKRPASGGILVLITLYGGNDGLNTVVPYEDGAYHSQRGGIAIDPASVLPLGSGLGFNPALKGLKTMWDAGKVAIVRGVGYADPNYSHFASMDIWQCGSTRPDVTTGWLGRWLDATGNDPLRAIVLGDTVFPAFAGERVQASSIVSSSSPDSQLPPGDKEFQAVFKMLAHPRKGESALEVAVGRSGTSLLKVSKTVASGLRDVGPSPAVDDDAAGWLGTQLAVVAQLINAGLPTEAYGVDLQGFDTHAGEVDTQSQLLAQVDAAVSGFFTALGGGARANDVTAVIYTEFGRRVQSNASGGTDHGAANDVFVVGNNVRGGFYGEQPSLTQLDVDGNLVTSTDFRTVYASMLEQVLGVTSRRFLGHPFSGLSLVA